MALLSVENLNQVLGKKAILSSITFQADQRMITVLLGPNGAGKTTLLKSIIGLYPITSTTNNRIIFNNATITGWSIHKRVECGLLYMPQHTSLFQHMSVIHNLKVVYQYHSGWNNKPYDHFQEEVDRWLELTHLSATKHQKVETLSGGQKRKLEVVRALLMKPKMLMLDEPFAGVDPKSIYELKQIFTNLAQSGIGIIISDHHVDQLLSIANAVYVIVGGHVVTSGSIKDILENAYTKESYLGDQFYQEIAQRYLS